MCGLSYPAFQVILYYGTVLVLVHTKVRQIRYLITLMHHFEEKQYNYAINKLLNNIISFGFFAYFSKSHLTTSTINSGDTGLILHITWQSEYKNTGVCHKKLFLQIFLFSLFQRTSLCYRHISTLLAQSWWTIKAYIQSLYATWRNATGRSTSMVMIIII